MISTLFVVAVLAGFLVSASMGVVYLKPACPKCGSRAAVSYKKVKGRAKKRHKTAYTCEDCDRDFTLKKNPGVAYQAKLLLGAAAACLVIFAVNHAYDMIQQDRTLDALRDNPSLVRLIEEGNPGGPSKLSHADFDYYVHKRTTPRATVEAFLDAHRNAKRVESTGDSVTYAFRYGWLPSNKRGVTFDEKGRYLERKTTWW